MSKLYKTEKSPRMKTELVLKDRLSSFASYLNKVAGCNKYRTNNALSRRFIVINSFYLFYYSKGMIDCIPTLRASRPKKIRTAPVLISDEDIPLFGPDNNITAKSLCYTYRNNIYNNTKSVSKTAKLCGNDTDTIEVLYKVDLKERISYDGSEQDIFT